MAQHWIQSEFARTGLPKSALSDYLGVDNAAISRTLGGERQLTLEENDLARGFFSIVPDDADASLIDAIRRLRSTKIREAAGLGLSKFLLERIEQGQDDLHMLLTKVVDRTATLTADQIVALCRLLGIQVEGLHLVNAPTSGKWAEFGNNILAALRREARQWVKDQGLAYQFDRMAELVAPRASASKTNFTKLQPADTAGDDLAFCIPYLIPDDSYAPRFEQGQTIFLDTRSEPRKGDYVAALLADSNSEDVKAVLGRLLYVSREQIGISSARSIRTEVAKKDVAELRRIAFCKM